MPIPNAAKIITAPIIIVTTSGFESDVLLSVSLGTELLQRERIRRQIAAHSNERS